MTNATQSSLAEHPGFILVREKDFRYVRHRTLFEAVQEAHRLARKEHDRFYVFAPMKSVGPVVPVVHPIVVQDVESPIPVVYSHTETF